MSIDDGLALYLDRVKACRHDDIRPIFRAVGLYACMDCGKITDRVGEPVEEIS